MTQWKDIKYISMQYDVLKSRAIYRKLGLLGACAYYYGKKYALDKVYALNKKVSNYVVMAFFSDNTSILSFVVTGYGCMLTMHVLRAFSVTRPLNARLRKARPVLHGAEKPRTR